MTLLDECCHRLGWDVVAQWRVRRPWAGDALRVRAEEADGRGGRDRRQGVRKGGCDSVLELIWAIDNRSSQWECELQQWTLHTFILSSTLLNIWSIVGTPSQLSCVWDCVYQVLPRLKFEYTLRYRTTLRVFYSAQYWKTSSYPSFVNCGRPLKRGASNDFSLVVVGRGGLYQVDDLPNLGRETQSPLRKPLRYTRRSPFPPMNLRFKGYVFIATLFIMKNSVWIVSNNMVIILVYYWFL